jgi:hypothetical protein
MAPPRPHNGYANAATNDAAIAIGHTESFQPTLRAAVAKARGGDISGAAEDLRQAALDQADLFPAHTSLDDIDFAQLITLEAEEEGIY